MYIYIYTLVVCFRLEESITFTTGVCSGGGRGDPPETLKGLTRNLLSVCIICVCIYIYIYTYIHTYIIMSPSCT